MAQDGLDDLPILNETDDPHGSPTFRADERIDLIDFLNQPGPAFPAGRRGSIGFDDTGDGAFFGKLLSFPPGNVAVPTVIPDRLLPPVRDMGTHGGEPFRCVKDLSEFAAFCRIDDGSLVGEILHPFLGEGCPDDVPSQILNRVVFLRLDTVPAEDMESGMPPCGEHGDNFL